MTSQNKSTIWGRHMAIVNSAGSEMIKKQGEAERGLDSVHLDHV